MKPEDCVRNGRRFAIMCCNPFLSYELPLHIQVVKAWRIAHTTGVPEWADSHGNHFPLGSQTLLIMINLHQFAFVLYLASQFVQELRHSELGA